MSVFYEASASLVSATANTIQIFTKYVQKHIPTCFTSKLQYEFVINTTKNVREIAYRETLNL